MWSEGELDAFILDYIGFRAVTLMMIIDNVAFQCYGIKVSGPHDLREKAVEKSTRAIERLRSKGLIEQDSFRFYRRVYKECHCEALADALSTAYTLLKGFDGKIEDKPYNDAIAGMHKVLERWRCRGIDHDSPRVP